MIYSYKNKIKKIKKIQKYYHKERLDPIN